MSSKSGSGFGYFLAGLGIGAAIALLIAPRTGEDTREYLRKSADKGRDYLKEHSGEVKETARRVAEHGRKIVDEQKHTLESALEAGRRAYSEEKEKHGA